MNPEIPLTLTFDDVLLEPRYSDVLPTEVTAHDTRPRYRPSHPGRLGSHGYSDRESPSYRYGARGGPWIHSQEFEH